MKCSSRYDEMSYEFLEKGLFVTSTDRRYFIPYSSITSIETSTIFKPQICIYYFPHKWSGKIEITYNSVEEMNDAMRDIVQNYNCVSKEPCELSHAKRRFVDISE
jgi:hypothetical protein